MRIQILELLSEGNKNVNELQDGYESLLIAGFMAGIILVLLGFHGNTKDRFE